MSFVENYNKELYHHGVKGMKWGVRKTRKWATAKHQPSSVKSSVLAGVYAATRNERVGKALDKSDDRDAKNWERAKADYKRYKQSNVQNTQKQKAASIAKKGAKKTAKILGNIGTAYITDQVFNDGMGTRIVKSTVKYAGRAAVSAYVASRGGYDIHWYDN